MKKILIVIIIGIIIVFMIDFFGRRIEISYHIQVRIPILCRTEYERYSPDVFHNEDVYIFYLSKHQTKYMIKKICKNENWREIPIQKDISRLFSDDSLYNLYDRFPNVEHGYWIFKNRHNNVAEPYDISKVYEANDAFSLGILDIDSNIFYYFAMDV